MQYQKNERKQAAGNLQEHLFLIGFMGVGKTSTSHALSRKLGVREIDTDDLIVRQEGRSIPVIFEQEGEEYFRKAETAVLDKLAEQEPCIVSCGGGMVLRPENVRKMKSRGRVLFLTAEPETIYERVKDNTNRPLLNGHMNVEYIRRMIQEREPVYRAAADMEIATDGLFPRQVAEQILRLLTQRQQNGRKGPAKEST